MIKSDSEWHLERLKQNWKTLKWHLSALPEEEVLYLLSCPPDRWISHAMGNLNQKQCLVGHLYTFRYGEFQNWPLGCGHAELQMMGIFDHLSRIKGHIPVVERIHQFLRSLK